MTRPVAVLLLVAAYSLPVCRADDAATTEATEPAGAAPRLPDKTVRLEFKLVPAKREKASLLVLCAEGEYLVSRDVSEAGANNSIRIAGKLRPLDRPDRLLLTYEATLRRLDKENVVDAAYSAGGNVVIGFGRTVTLCYFGEGSLTVTASIEDEGAGRPASMRPVPARGRPPKTPDRARVRTRKPPPQKPPGREPKRAAPETANHFHDIGSSNIIVIGVNTTANIGSAAEKGGFKRAPGSSSGRAAAQ